MEDVHRAGGVMGILGELDRAGLIQGKSVWVQPTEPTSAATCPTSPDMTPRCGCRHITQSMLIHRPLAPKLQRLSRGSSSQSAG